MISINIQQIEEQVPEGITYGELAKAHQDKYDHDIVLVRVNQKLQELHKKVIKPCSIEFVTTADKAGYRSYRRSLLLMMEKAIYDVIPCDKIEKVSVKFSVPGGLYVEAVGDFAMDEEFIANLFSDMTSLYRLDQLELQGGAGQGEKVLGELPKASKVLLSALLGAWALILLYGAIQLVKSKRNEN